MKQVQDIAELSRRIAELKERRRAVVLAHYYQSPEVQEVADFIGDSLQLARQAAATAAEVIVFCGVFFMAESAKILSPDKVVLLPEPEAGCPLADMASAEALRQKKAEVPGCLVVSYVNSSAAVKAESDVICTSANAERVVASLPADKPVIFVPDGNLGHYVSRKTGRPLILWGGYCHVHHDLRAADIARARSEHPGAPVLVHPECRPEVVELADCVTSTGGMIRYVQESSERSFIIGTEEGLLHFLRKSCPDREFYPAARHLVCPNMKLTTLEKVKWSLESLEPQIQVDPAVQEGAHRALARMLALG